LADRTWRTTLALFMVPAYPLNRFSLTPHPADKVMSVLVTAPALDLDLVGEPSQLGTRSPGEATEVLSRVYAVWNDEGKRSLVSISHGEMFLSSSQDEFDLLTCDYDRASPCKKVMYRVQEVTKSLVIC
jgi:hypothetical protein